MVIFFVCLVPLWFCSPAQWFGITWMASCKGPITCLLDCGEVYYELAAIHMFFFFINTYRHPIWQSADWSFPLWVISLTSYDIPLRSEMSAAHVYALFSQPWYKKVCYACIYLTISAVGQANTVRELTQHVRNDFRSQRTGHWQNDS